MKVNVYWIPECPVGRLAIMPRPRTGDWLEDEIRAWKRLARQIGKNAWALTT